MENAWLNEIKWTEDGLIATIAQDHVSKRILMMAWMNHESLQLSIAEKRAIYWSRSRKKLWRKGEESGNVQILHNIFLDCDADAILLNVEQVGGVACHTGRESCFYQELKNNKWEAIDPVLKQPEDMYKK